MSEDGWRAFVSSDELDDWAVLHGGPTATFRVRSLQHAALLAASVAELPGLGDRILLTVTSDRLTVKLTREMWATQHQHVELARAISALARQHGAIAEPDAAQEVQVAIAAKPDAIDLPFWRAVLGYSPMHDDNCIDPLGQGSTVWMQDIDPAKPLRHAMHLDVSLPKEHIRTRVEDAVAVGGLIVEESEAPRAWILADSSGNKVCLAAWPDGAGLSRPVSEPVRRTTEDGDRPR